MQVERLSRSYMVGASRQGCYTSLLYPWADGLICRGWPLLPGGGHEPLQSGVGVHACLIDSTRWWAWRVSRQQRQWPPGHRRRARLHRAPLRRGDPAGQPGCSGGCQARHRGDLQLNLADDVIFRALHN